MRDAKKHVVLITGGASGIGRAAVRRFAAEGFAVVAIDRQRDLLQTVACECPGTEPFDCDVTDHAALGRCVDETIQRHGRIDALVNNAGFSYYERHTLSTLEHWRHTQSINVEAMYVLAKHVVPPMIKQNYGRIVNVSSTQAIAAEGTVGAYAASKGAIGAWSRSLAVDLAEYGILVNVVAPGCIHTPMSVIAGVDETQSALFKEWYIKNRKIPLARPGNPEEVANAIFFLAGDQCGYITGQTLIVDGGLTITF
ncbi:MAG TPA: SDR family oxidoreductase [Tepidisphaeraceae bacterium]|jgi:NAD(P)-dependent dehydrogenase (short-subunit alcohol dehydrogenase family)|nr:SDR family oxidoreductase [Tepidisphaeraceae bacterium]